MITESPASQGPPVVGQDRPHPPAVLAALSSRSQIPDEVRIPLTLLLSQETSTGFLEAVIDWRITSIYVINLKPKDLISLFDRYDKVFVERVQELYDSPAGSADAEQNIEILLKAGIQILEHLKTVKHVILFKSADLLLEIFRRTTRFSNLLLATELFTHFMKAFRKKELIQEYLKNCMFQLITCIYIFAHQFNILAPELKYQLEDLMPTAENKKKLSELTRHPSVTIDITREYNMDFQYLEEFENSSMRKEQTASVADIVRQPVSELASGIDSLVDQKIKIALDDNSPLYYALRFKILFFKELQQSGDALRVATLSLQSLTIFHCISEDSAYLNMMKACHRMLSPLRMDLSWETVESLLHNTYPIDFYIALLEAKWSFIQSSAFNQDQVNLMHQLLQRIMTGIQRLYQREKADQSKISVRKVVRGTPGEHRTVRGQSDKAPLRFYRRALRHRNR